MTELDFDELDKAVNNLMAEVDTSKPDGSAPIDTSEAVVTIPTTTAPATPAAPVTPVAPTTAPVAPAAATPVGPSLATKRRGQFMDVVHPSSSMAKPMPTVRREAVTVVPAHDDVTPEAPAEPVSVPPVEQPTPALEPAPEPVLSVEPTEATGVDQSSTGDSFAMPDPIDFANQHQQAEPESSDDVAVEPEVADNAVDETPAPQEESSQSDTPQLEPEDKPLSSPFLPDAKVEKRPLGGLPVEPVVEASTPAAETAAVTEPALEPNMETGAEGATESDTVPADDAQIPPEVPPAPEPEPEAIKPLPEELAGDIMALESSTTGASEPKSDEPAADAMSTVEAQPATGVGPASIPQQYAEQPSTGDQSNGSIYDTAAYHQPLAHPEKHKSSWGMIIAIIVLLIVGALGGAAYFYFVSK